MKSSRALRRVSSLKITDLSGTICPHHQGLNLMSHQTLMMGTAMVPETSVIFNQLTMLMAREDFIDYKIPACSDLWSCLVKIFVS
jgi:hypothetical protein